MSTNRISLQERETVITINDNDKTARILTWQRPLQKRLSKNLEAKLINEGIHQHPDDRYMLFEIPKDLVSVRNRKKLSPEARKRLADTMAARMADIIAGK